MSGDSSRIRILAVDDHPLVRDGLAGLIAAGNAKKQIADQLGVTEDTVKGRVKSILAKLDANDRTHRAIIGVKRGIIEV